MYEGSQMKDRISVSDRNLRQPPDKMLREWKLGTKKWVKLLHLL